MVKRKTSDRAFMIIGFVDEYGLEGLLLLKADDGKEFHMHAFSGEVARHISEFHSGNQSVPTI